MPQRRIRTRGVTTAIAVLVSMAGVLGLAADAEAQYFGRNKVQYRQFDFRVLQTEHFDIYYYPEEEAAVRLAARMAERWYTRLSTLLAHQLSTRQPVVLYAAHPHFEQTNILGGELGEGTGGVTESLRRRVILPFAGGLAETDHVLGHELVHAFQYDIAATRDPEGNRVGPGVEQLPLWFIEGMAEYLSVGPVDPLTAMWIRDATARETMPTVQQLDDPRFFPYRYGQAFWAYVGGRWGDETVGRMLKAVGTGGDVAGAMQRVLGLDEETFTREWHQATARTYAAVLETTSGPETVGRALIVSGRTGGDMNVSPALSPDGTRVAFLSERSGFSIDLYVADAMTGRIERRLASTAGDPHFESLQFLSSAGDWSPDGRAFLVAGLSRGTPVLTTIDVETGARVRERPIAEVDELFNPAWSPDGTRIVFSALKGGVLDLYLLDLRDDTVTRLTDDPYTDLDPEWAPDGRSLAWVTDRFSSNLETLAFGPTRIGRLDLASRAATELAGIEGARTASPEFGSDGATLWFVATGGGIPNIYRLDLAAGGVPVQITNLRSGVAGITATTPALTVAAKAPTLVFSVYEADHYNLYAAPASTTAPAGVPARGVPATDGRPSDAARLPPADRTDGVVQRALRTPTAGLPRPASFETRDYRARLRLDGIAQPTVGIGADRFGAYGAGGVAFQWSDMLGNHQLGTTVQLTSRFEEAGGAVSYINRTHRWNWGLVGEQLPYVTGTISQGVTTVNGASTGVEQTYRLVQTDRAATVLAQYPFSRVQRLEFAGGVRQIGLSQRIETRLFSLATGEVFDTRRETLPSPAGLTLAEASTALVYDSSVNGATGPVVGQRYRLELTQLSGSLRYTGVLADVRRYVMPARPLTIAVRGLHYGRYGSDSADTRLSPVYLGYPGLVRGYEVASFDGRECVSQGRSTCVAFDRLVGSRMAVVSAELRAPLFGLFSRRSLYGPLPVELAVFADAGRTWAGGDGLFPSIDRPWVRSAGVALRFNAFGYVIGELDYVRPLDRPDRGWRWQFNLTPGF